MIFSWIQIVDLIIDTHIFIGVNSFFLIHLFYFIIFFGIIEKLLSVIGMFVCCILEESRIHPLFCFSALPSSASFREPWFLWACGWTKHLTRGDMSAHILVAVGFHYCPDRLLWHILYTEILFGINIRNFWFSVLMGGYLVSFYSTLTHGVFSNFTSVFLNLVFSVQNSLYLQELYQNSGQVYFYSFKWLSC